LDKRADTPARSEMKAAPYPLAGYRFRQMPMRLWRRRGQMYLPLIAIIGIVLLLRIAFGQHQLRDSMLPVFLSLAAAFAIRYLERIYLVHLQRWIIAVRMRRWVGQLGSAERRPLLLYSGMIGGGLLSGPLALAHAGVLDRRCFVRLSSWLNWGSCVYEYWGLLCFSFVGAILGACIGFFLYQTSFSQLKIYRAAQLTDVARRTERFLSCVKGGVVAMLIVTPVIFIGSAAVAAPVISVNLGILLGIISSVSFISILLIGAFRWLKDGIFAEPQFAADQAITPSRRL